MIPTLGHRHIGWSLRRAQRPATVGLAAVATTTALMFVLLAGHGSDAVCASGPASTRSPDLRVTALPGVNLRPVLALPGLAAASGPFPGAGTSLRTEARELSVWLESRPRDSLVDRPLLAAGTWVRPGGLVLELGLARRLDVRPGEPVTLATASGPVRRRVAGLALTSAARRTPSSEGVAYASTGDLREVAPDPHVRGSTVALQLADRSRSGEFARWLERRYPGRQVYVAQGFADGCRHT